MTRRTIGWWLFGLATLAFLLRVAAIFALKRWLQPNAIEHRALAISLVDYGTFYFRDFNYFGPSSVQSPPFPLLLAGLFKLFGRDANGAYIAAMIINSIAGAVTVVLTYRWVSVIGGDDRVGLLAATLVAIWPSQVYTATHVQAISLITAGVMAMFYFFQRAVDGGRAGPWIAYSVVGTLAALTEPVLLPVLALSGLLILAWPSLMMPQRLRNAAILFAAAVLIIMPWTIRNHIVHGGWIPIKSTFWVNVWKGNNPNATGTDRLEMSEQQKSTLKVTSITLDDQKLVDPNQDNLHQYDALTPEQRAELNHQPEAARERVFKRFTTEWISANHGRYFFLCVKRLGMTLLFDLDNPKARNIVWIGSRIVLLPLSLIGLVIAWRRGWRLFFSLLVGASALFTYSLTVTANRFAIPFEPLQLALAALVIVTFVKVRTKESPLVLIAPRSSTV